MSQTESVYTKFKKAEAKSYTAYVQPVLLWSAMAFLVAKRAAIAPMLGFDTPSAWRLLAFCAALLMVVSVGMSVASVVCSKHTGIIYGYDRTAFALAGGFDVGRWPPFVAAVVLYGIYWRTWQQKPDVLAMLRQPWIFLLIVLATGMILTAIVANIVFRAYARRHNIRVLKTSWNT